MIDITNFRPTEKNLEDIKNMQEDINTLETIINEMKSAMLEYKPIQEQLNILKQKRVAILNTYTNKKLKNVMENI